MSLRAVALAYAFGLALATAAWAASPKSPDAARAEPKAPVVMDLSVNWVPNWLKEPLARAIADATDPRERKKS